VLGSDECNAADEARRRRAINRSYNLLQKYKMNDQL
jgi:hypothetical protein